MKTLKAFTAAAGTFFLAAPLVHAAATGSGVTFLQFTNYIRMMVDAVVVPLLMTLSGFVFLYGVAKYFILSGDNAEEREKGRQFAIWGVLGLALIFSLWGVVAVLLSTFNL